MPERGANDEGGGGAVTGRERDTAGATVLGWLHLALALPVLVGTAFAELPIDRALNVACGVVLSAVGGGLLWGARRLRRAARPDQRST